MKTQQYPCFMFLLSLFATPAAFAVEDCVIQGDGTFSEVAPIQAVQVRLEHKNHFDAAEEGFRKGTTATPAVFAHKARQEWKTIWTGKCYGKNGESRDAKVISYAYNHQRTGAVVERIKLLPDWKDEAGDEEVFNRFRRSQYPREPIQGENAFLLYAGGGTALFSHTETKYVADVRVGDDQGKQKLYVAVKQPYPLSEKREDQTWQQRVLETYGDQPTYGYCELDHQYTNKITRLNDTAGCKDHYVKLKERYESFIFNKTVLTALLVPYNFLVAGASLAMTATEKSPAEEIAIMAEMLSELKAEKTPLIDQLYQHVMTENPKWGSKERMLQLLKTANDSYFFCSPNIATDDHYTLRGVGRMLLSGELSEDKFIK